MRICVRKETCWLEHILNLVLKMLWASLMTGNMDFFYMCSFHNWFPDMQTVLLMENNITGQ